MYGWKKFRIVYTHLLYSPAHIACHTIYNTHSPCIHTYTYIKGIYIFIYIHTHIHTRAHIYFAGYENEWDMYIKNECLNRVSMQNVKNIKRRRRRRKKHINSSNSNSTNNTTIFPCYFCRLELERIQHFIHISLRSFCIYIHLNVCINFHAGFHTLGMWSSHVSGGMIQA